jgi:hypothetical protein
MLTAALSFPGSLPNAAAHYAVPGRRIGISRARTEVEWDRPNEAGWRRSLLIDDRYYSVFVRQPTIFMEQLIAKPIWVKRGQENQVIVAYPFEYGQESNAPSE